MTLRLLPFLAFSLILGACAASSNQTGEVVKLLTMITLVTTPLTMVGTWYGMNFPNMPELHWKHGYMFAFIITIVSTGITLWWFKRKHWF